MKALKVTSIGQYGEQTVSHPLPSYISEDAAIVATLQGVINAGQSIVSFSVEVN